jgi:trans-aconitate 2-methyltransferase
MMTWDPEQYLLFSEERGLPFRHLLAAVQHLEPASIVDLGCGSGALTTSLIERWPSARITGIDGSTEMIAHARRRAVAERLIFEKGDVRTWTAPRQVDLLVSNACFHWIHDHRALFDHLVPQLAAGGSLAFQVPANHDSPSHTLLRDLCSSERWRDRLDGHPRTGVRDPQWYRNELGGRGLIVTAWQTTYHHALGGDDPVLEWVKGTTLRPVFDLLDAKDHLEFTSAYGALLREAYPESDGITLFPFNRLFVVTIRQ